MGAESGADSSVKPLLGGDGSPEIDSAFRGVAVNRFQLFLGERHVFQSIQRVVQLTDIARADQGRRDTGIAENPCNCQLGKALAA